MRNKGFILPSPRRSSRGSARLSARPRHTAGMGFTLIELSIVIVIIGLIIGGVLVGRDLIKGAEIRSTISQKEKFDAGVNTFRLKYGYIPGDMPPSIASQFGFFAFTGGIAGTSRYGDNNGAIEGAGGMCEGEMLAFWRHLSDASLIEGRYGSTGNAAIISTSGAPTGNVTTLAQSFPPAKLGANYFIAGYIANAGYRPSNAYQINALTLLDDNAFCYNTSGNSGVSPIDAYNMDGKVDDGYPLRGKVRVTSSSGADVFNFAPTWAATSTSAQCIIGSSATDTNATYNLISSSGGTDLSCSVFMYFN